MANKVVFQTIKDLTEAGEILVKYRLNNPLPKGFRRVFKKENTIIRRANAQVFYVDLNDPIDYSFRGFLGRSIKVTIENNLKEKWDKQAETSRKMRLMGKIGFMGLEGAINSCFGEDKKFLEQFRGMSKDQIRAELKKVSNEFYSAHL